MVQRSRALRCGFGRAAARPGEDARLERRQPSSMTRIIVLGAGVQGTLYGVRLARTGHHVTLVARGRRAEDLLRLGAVIEHAATGRSERVHLPIVTQIDCASVADVCLVTVRREQLDGVLPSLQVAPGLARIVFMV